jgi:hypothetical protein
MRRAGAKAPASGRALRLDVQVDDPSGTGSRHFESMVGTIDADLLEAERVDEERFLFAHVANRQHGPKEAARPGVSRDLGRRPRIRSSPLSSIISKSSPAGCRTRRYFVPNRSCTPLCSAGGD